MFLLGFIVVIFVILVFLVGLKVKVWSAHYYNIVVMFGLEELFKLNQGIGMFGVKGFGQGFIIVHVFR